MPTYEYVPGCLHRNRFSHCNTSHNPHPAGPLHRRRPKAGQIGRRRREHGGRSRRRRKLIVEPCQGKVEAVLDRRRSANIHRPGREQVLITEQGALHRRRRLRARFFGRPRLRAKYLLRLGSLDRGFENLLFGRLLFFWSWRGFSCCRATVRDFLEGCHLA